MKKHFLILGDVRIGDCFHAGTYLNRLKADYETVWIHGTYEEKAVEFLAHYTDLNISRTIIRPSVAEPVPMDAEAVERFRNHYRRELEPDDYDLITSSAQPIFFGQNDPVIFKTKNLPVLEGLPDRYIVTHFDTISYWKNLPFLYNMDFGIPTIAVGLPGERINKYAADCRGQDLSVVASLMLNSVGVIGVHSSMACLAFHLDVPLIACHFGGNGLAVRFSDFSPKCWDIIYPEESKVRKALEQLQ